MLEVVLRYRQDGPLPWLSFVHVPPTLQCESVRTMRGREDTYVCALPSKLYPCSNQIALNCFQGMCQFLPRVCPSMGVPTPVPAEWLRGSSLGTVNRAWTFGLEFPHCMHTRPLRGTGPSLRWKEEGGGLQAGPGAGSPHAATFHHGTPRSLGILKLNLTVQVL